MDIFIWTIIICLFILSFIGLFIPIVPAVIAIWIGFLIYHFAINSEQLTVLFWIAMVVFTVVLIGSDLLTNKYFVNKFGGSRKSEWGAIIGVIVGIFIYPPLGMILVPFLIVFVIEITSGRTAKQSSLAAIGALAGFLSGIIAKMLIQLGMIIWFVITVLL